MKLTREAQSDYRDDNPASSYALAPGGVIDEHHQRHARNAALIASVVSGLYPEENRSIRSFYKVQSLSADSFSRRRR